MTLALLFSFVNRIPGKVNPSQLVEIEITEMQARDALWWDRRMGPHNVKIAHRADRFWPRWILLYNSARGRGLDSQFEFLSLRTRYGAAYYWGHSSDLDKNMNEFMKLDIDAPATIKAVLKAVIMIGERDETEVQQLATEDRLRELFPFRARESQTPPDFEDRQALKRASAMPLSRHERRDLIQASMPTKNENKPEILSLLDLMQSPSSAS